MQLITSITLASAALIGTFPSTRSPSLMRMAASLRPKEQEPRTEPEDVMERVALRILERRRQQQPVEPPPQLPPE